jgi:predicted transcriptional regulator
LADTVPSNDLLALTADIVSAHVGNNNVTAAELPGLIVSVHKALSGAGAPAEPAAPPQQPAVPIRSSVKPDHIISLESGKKMKMLKRYLMTNYGMTPADYRAKWGLPKDYPMVAPNYAQQRKALAMKIGLGRGRRGAAKPVAVAAEV